MSFHALGMGVSYVVLLTAFYVDNDSLQAHQLRRIRDG
jgi:hypothetical protein